MSKIFKIVLMVCVVMVALAVSGSMIYYFAFAKPGIERAELEWEKEKQNKEDIKERMEKREEEKAEALRELELSRCLDDAYDTYNKQWNEKCKELGEPDDCALPFDTAELFNKYHDNAKEQCFKLYGPD